MVMIRTVIILVMVLCMGRMLRMVMMETMIIFVMVLWMERMLNVKDDDEGND
jgi:Ca2+/Na+ antiporter